MRAPAVVLCVALLAGLSAACGVRVQESPEAVPSALQPSFPAGPDRQGQPGQGVGYLVDGAVLVRHPLPAASTDVQDSLRALLALEGPVGRRRSAVPPGTQLRSLERDGDLVRVELDERFGAVRGRDQALAAAQIVFTVTERPPARRVQILVDGRPVAIPTQDGSSGGEPVTRASYSTFAPR